MRQFCKDIKAMRQYRHTRRAVWPYTKLRVGQFLFLGFSLMVLLPLVVLLIAYWLGQFAEWANDRLGNVPPWSWVRRYNSKLAERQRQFVGQASRYIRPRRVRG